MRILLTADPELPVPPRLYGGIERIVDSLARGLAGLGHEVGLVAHRDSTCPAARLYPWPGAQSQRRVDALRNTVALWRAVSDFRPDVLHSFSRLAYMLPLMKRRLPKIMSYQRDPGTANVRRAARLGGATIRFTGCSEHICERGRRGGGEWTAIPNFVEMATYDFAPRVDADAPLAFLSRVERIKGTHTAIAAAKRAGRRLVIAGNHGEEGEALRYWREEIEPHVDGKAVEYVGPVDDAAKNRLLGSAAAMIVPIEWDEPFGIVFAEALACGTPVIACPRGALPEIVEHGRHGYLVRSIEEAVDAVAKLPSIDRAECRRRAEDLFSSQVVVGQYAALHERAARESMAKQCAAS